jgi:hypothetical protein
VYYKLEEATRGTSYAASIKPFQRTKNGRQAWLALSNQFAGNDKWEAEIKKHEQLLHTRTWKGQTNFTLERFIAQHRNAFVSMQAAAEHVTYQLPNERSRVGFLLDAILSSDAGLQAAMASIKTDQTPTGLRNDFEAAATHLLPYDPVLKKRSDQAGGKRNSADISETTGEAVNISSFGSKKGTGSSGVPLRYHTFAEYKELSTEQKKELTEWRESSGYTPTKDKGSKGGKGGKKNGESDRRSVQAQTTKAIASAVDKKVNERMKALDKKTKEGTETEAYIMSLFEKFNGGKKVTISDVKVSEPANSTAPASSGPTLKTILKRSKNGSDK